MANQKEYKIIIQGIKESIEGIGTLQDSLNKLGKKVEDSGGAFKTASNSMDELAKTEQKIAEYNKEYQTALQSNKMVLQENANEIKNKLDLEKAELTVSENLRETYTQKQQLLTAMGKVIKNTAGDTSELQQQYAELNQELKDFDASLGNHQRNVGDYEIATKGLKVQLKEMQAEMANMLVNGIDKADPKFVELAQKAGQLKDAIGDAGEEISRFASDTKKLDDVINIAQSATAAFELYKGAMSAFGLETEGAVEAIQKLQGAMAIIQSLQTLQNTLEQNSATAKAFKIVMKATGGELVATQLASIKATIAQEGLSKAQKVGAVASKTLGLALKAIPLMAVIGLVMTLITYWEDIVGWFKNTFPILGKLSDKFNGFKGVIMGVGQAIVHWLTNPIVTFAKVIKKVFTGDFSGAVSEAINGIKNQFTGLPKAFKAGVEKTRKVIEETVDNGHKTIENKVKTHTSNVVNTHKEANKEIVDDEKKKIEELKRLNEELHKERQKTSDLNLESSKIDLNETKRRLQLQIKEEKNLEKKKELYDDLKAVEIELVNLQKSHDEAKIFDDVNEKLGGVFKNIDEFKAEVQGTTDKVTGFSEIELTYFTNAALQMENLAKKAKNEIQNINDETAQQTKDSGSTSGSTSSTNKKSGSDKWHEIIFGGDGTPDKLSEKAKELAEVVNAAYRETIGPLTENVLGLGDVIGMAMEFAIEEAEDALDEADELHEKAANRVEESRNRIADLQDQMKNASASELGQLKTQVADEMLLMAQREAEEKRLQKEKEKREAELENEKKKKRKLELHQQLIQAIVSGALAVVNGFATQPFVPVGIAMGALAGAATAIQIATITKQISKLADGGIINGKPHSQGGARIEGTNIEVEGGEYVVNKRSTAKYLPLLQAINAEGARKKTVANQIGKYADGGELNYDKISSNLDTTNVNKVIQSSIAQIDMHPQVSVVDINRGQKNLATVRQMAGASK